MNITTQERIAFVRQSADFIFAAIEFRYHMLTALLLERKSRDSSDEIVGLAWDIIDWAERLRTIMHSAVGIKSNDPWLKWFTGELRPMDSLRNIIQHLPGSIEECLRDQVPLFGHVSAYCASRNGSGYDIVIAVASPLKKQTLNNPHIYLEKQIDFRPPIDQVRLQVGKHHINITNFMEMITNGRRQFSERAPNHAVEGTAPR